MAHHSYWMLQGVGNGSVKDQDRSRSKLAKNTRPAKPESPRRSGARWTVKSVEGTPFDFRKPKAIGKDLEAAGGKPIGFDHNWVVNGEPRKMRPAAKLKDAKSGRVMTIEADQPGVQFYTGNFLDGTITGKGVKYSSTTRSASRPRRSRMPSTSRRGKTKSF